MKKLLTLAVFFSAFASAAFAQVEFPFTACSISPSGRRKNTPPFHKFIIVYHNFGLCRNPCQRIP